MIETAGAFAAPGSLENQITTNFHAPFADCGHSNVPYSNDTFSNQTFPESSFRASEVSPNPAHTSQTSNAAVDYSRTGNRDFRPGAPVVAAAEFSQTTIAPDAAGGHVGFAPLRVAALGDYPLLGNISVSRIKPDDILFMRFERFPVSDAGACEIALAVLRQIQQDQLLGKPVLVEFAKIDRRFHERYTGAVSAEHLAYPCLLLNEALPMNTPFKVVSAEIMGSGISEKFRLQRVLETSTGAALKTEPREWLGAQLTGFERPLPSSKTDELRWAISAVEFRHREVLAAASRAPRPGKMSGADAEQPRAA